MIKIYDGEVFAIDINYYNRMDVLRQCWQMENCEKKKFLIFDGDEIIAAWSYHDIVMKREVEPFCLQVSPDMFKEAREYFERNQSENGSCIPVFDAKGECLFLLELVLNKKSDWTRHGRFCRETFDTEGFVDYTLFEGIKGVFFYRLEEYTYIITNILRERFPQMEIVFLDEYAELFWENITVCEELDGLKYYLEREKYMHITSDYKIPDKGNVYSSLGVMHALFSFGRVDSYGELNADRIIFIIDFYMGECGLMDYIKFSCMWILFAYEKGWFPIVNYNSYPNQYLRKEGENMWEYYFLPVSDISLEDALKSKYVISAKKNGLKRSEDENPLWKRCCEKIGQKVNGSSICSKILKFNYSTKVYLEEICQSVLRDRKVLGVVMRGTDFRQESIEYREESVKVAKTEGILAKIKQEKDRGKYDCIFLATEEEEYLELFREEFGEELLYIEQKRVRFEAGDEKKLVAELLDISGNEEFAKQYLSVLYTLSKCDGLLTNIGCGAYEFALWMKDGDYEVNRNFTEEELTYH